MAKTVNNPRSNTRLAASSGRPFVEETGLTSQEIGNRRPGYHRGSNLGHKGAKPEQLVVAAGLASLSAVFRTFSKRVRNVEKNETGNYAEATFQNVNLRKQNFIIFNGDFVDA